MGIIIVALAGVLLAAMSLPRVSTTSASSPGSKYLATTVWTKSSVKSMLTARVHPPCPSKSRGSENVTRFDVTFVVGSVYVYGSCHTPTLISAMVIEAIVRV